jgi:hypothetical protein
MKLNMPLLLRFQSGHNGDDLDMGIDTSNVSSSGSRRQPGGKRSRKKSGDSIEKRIRRDAESSDECPMSSEEPHQLPPSPGQMKIIAPDPGLLVELPQPSPATCGKRKVWFYFLLMFICCDTATEYETLTNDLIKTICTGSGTCSRTSVGGSCHTG